MFDNELIKELYPGAEGIMFQPMLIHASTDSQLQRVCESGEYFGQLKKDGALYQFIKGHNGKCYLFGRTVSKKTGLLTEKIANVPHIKDAFKELPNDTIILGEIYYPGGSSRNTTEIMGCLPAKAIERQEAGTRGYIHYYVYDILMYDGINFIKAQTDNETRYKIIAKIFELYNLDQYPFLELAEVWYDNLYERVGDALDSGEEGMVIKKKTGIYEPGKRPDSNLKAKRVDFADVVITGFQEPTKEYYGKDIENWQYWITKDNERLPIGTHTQLEDFNITAQFSNFDSIIAVTKPYYMGWNNSRITIGAYNSKGELEEIGVIHSGISDEMKEDMTNNPDKYFGHVAKIQMMEKDKVNHTVRHGFYKQLHDDKNPIDCTIDSIF